MLAEQITETVPTKWNKKKLVL